MFFKLYCLYRHEKHHCALADKVDEMN